ncbi:MAG TPA: hypothetical protein QGF35_08605 [Dehalococcoidia bacterium]|nr:hypothetical protein [Dehalococcoidia bacterium]
MAGPDLRVRVRLAGCHRSLFGALVRFQSASAQTWEDFTLGGLLAYLITPVREAIP